MQAVTTVRFDPETREQLDAMAEQLDRPRAWIIKEAVTQYLEREAWYRAEVQKGLADAEAGRVISHEQMGERLRAKGFNVMKVMYGKKHALLSMPGEPCKLGYRAQLRRQLSRTPFIKGLCSLK